MSSAQIETTCGKIEGEQHGECSVFRGIPFATPPIGPLRFCAPRPPMPWHGVRSALAFGPAAMQGTSKVMGMDAAGPKSEDCLYLNVYTPATDGKKRPVMFWIHGGAFKLGSASSPIYDGSRLALRGDVVVVTTNYRLGPLGYLSLAEHGGARFGASANCGQLDQIAALEWVKANIERFGGDPDNVTIFGESAGGMAVAALLCMPAARGLFHRAISQSGAATFTTRPEQAVELSSRLLDRLGIRDGDGARLRELPAEDIIEAHEHVGADLGIRSGLGPVVDGSTLPEQPGAAIAARTASLVPIMIGTNRDEMNLFNSARLRDIDMPMDDGEAARIVQLFVAGLPLERASALLEAYRSSRSAAKLPSGNRALLNAIQGDQLFRVPSLRFTEAYAAQQPETYSYLFTYESPAMRGALGSCHALELAFMFGTLDAPFQDRFAGTGPEVEKLSQLMMDAWLEHARRGAPGTSSLAWPRYDANERATMIFDKQTRLELAPFEAERTAWDGIELGPRT
jgi:para-nitrobenzyl esterase